MIFITKEIEALEVELEANPEGYLDYEDDDEPEMYGHQQKYGNQVKSIVGFYFMKNQRRLKIRRGIKNLEKALNHGKKYFLLPLKGFSGPLKAAMEGLKTTEGLKVVSLTFYLED